MRLDCTYLSALAASRPLNSALEIDLDFERAVQPPPQPTEESTGTLEDLIKRRIAERSFDDPVRRAPPPDTLQKELAKLDDRKASKVCVRLQLCLRWPPYNRIAFRNSFLP